MTDEPFDGFKRLDSLIEPHVSPIGGWLSLWQPRHTVATLAILPGIFAINSIISGWEAGPLAISLIAVVSIAQAVTAGSYLPQKARTEAIETCSAIPILTMFAASALLSEVSSSLTFGFLALAVLGAGAVLRFFGTVCS